LWIKSRTTSVLGWILLNKKHSEEEIVPLKERRS